MDEKVVLVTGIGGNVGQGIIRNIHASGYPIKVIGTNVQQFSAGNHLCDAIYKTPFATQLNYIAAIQKIVDKEQVDLILPATDYEGYYLAKHREDINCKVLTSHFDTMSIYLDKYKSFKHHEAHQISFAHAMLPSAYDGRYPKSIAKPKEGRGSRGLVIDPEHWKDLDDTYMIQERHEGVEITVAFYVKKNGVLHGFITMERSLENGATQECEVVTTYDKKVASLLDQIIAHANIRGSANVQAIVDKEGEIHVFEVNCRISGTNSIRHNFGFQDVVYALQEYLYNMEPDVPKVTKGKAVRILMDIIYPESGETKFNKNSNHLLY